MKFGFVSKLIAEWRDPLDYFLPLNDKKIPLNPLLGKPITLEFSGKIKCIACGRAIKKSYQQGYCFPCTQRLAECDLCIVRPETCHFHLGTCREPQWAERHCMIPHILYLANTSDLKVGITRETQIPTRWIDQGAIQALPLARLHSRYAAGILEMKFAQHIKDKTVWRKMLGAPGTSLDLKEIWKEKNSLPELKHTLQQRDQNVGIVEWLNLEQEDVRNFSYPVLEYPKKIKSLTLKEDEPMVGTLLGIKGQYLMLEVGVINIRSIVGYEIKIGEPI